MARDVQTDRAADQHGADRGRDEQELEPRGEATAGQRGEEPHLYRGTRFQGDVGRHQRGSEPDPYDARQARARHLTECSSPVGRVGTARLPRERKAQPRADGNQRGVHRHDPLTSNATPARRAGRAGEASATSAPSRRSNNGRTRDTAPLEVAVVDVEIGSELGHRIDAAGAVGSACDEDDCVERGRDLVSDRGERKRQPREQNQRLETARARRPVRSRESSTAIRRDRC